MECKKFKDGFSAGVLVALQTLRAQGQETCAIEIMQGIGDYSEIFNYAFNNENEVDLDTVSWLQDIATPNDRKERIMRIQQERKARELLQKHALKHAKVITGRHDYLPETDDEAQAFEPHKWAVDAVVEALSVEPEAAP